jgi:pimeloyl-ACP methyl ester carboxylesterase
LLLTVTVLLAIFIYSYKVDDKPLSELTQRWAPPPSQFLNIAGMNIHLRDEGPKTDEQPIVLIHGTAASLHTWDGWTDALKTQRRVIRFDLPAFGLTGPDPQDNYTIERYAEVVVAVLDQLDIKTSVLAGNSLGGYIAWATAVLYPERVAKLVLVDASGYPFESESMPIAFKISANPIASAILKDFLPKFLIENSVKNVYGNPELVTDDVVERYYQLTLREGNRAALQERFKQTQPGELAAKVSSIDVPTLIIWGGQDKLIPSKLGKQFEKDIKNSKLVIFDNLGHIPHEEDPQGTVLAVQQFLQGNE